MVDEDDPVQVKFECKEVNPCENSQAVHISPHNSGTVTDSEKSSITHGLSNEPPIEVMRHT